MKTQLKIFIDFKSPASYFAWHGTQPLIEEFAGHLDALWCPFPVNVQTVPVKEAEEDRGQSHRRVRAQARQNTHLFYAEQLGLPMQFAATPKGCDLALAILSAPSELSLGDATDFIQRAFKAYWAEAQDLNDPEILAALGASPKALEWCLQQDLGVHLATIKQQATDDHGVIDAPAYVIADQIFIGREHLPWIREIIRGTD